MDGAVQKSYLRVRFIHHVFAYYRWTETDQVPTPDGLVKFHIARKLTREV